MRTAILLLRACATGLLASIASIAAGPALSQTVNSSAAALGMGENYTAIATGADAVHWNPANLGLLRNPSYSVTLLSLNVAAGLGPITLGDIADYEGRQLTDEAKERWLQRIEESGKEQGTVGAAGALAFSIGSFAFQTSAQAGLEAGIGPGAAELVLFGNTGRTGDPSDIRIGSSSIDGAGYSSFSVSHGREIPVRLGTDRINRVAAGATLKYAMGHFLVHGRDNNSVTQADPLAVEIRFPLAFSDLKENGIVQGKGFGLDLGGAVEGYNWIASAALKNVFNTFEWDTDAMLYVPGEASWSEEIQESDFDQVPFSEAPSWFRRSVRERTFDPALALGGSYDATHSLTLAADLRHRFGDGLPLGPRTHFGAGADLALPFVSLQTGWAVVSDGLQLAGGLALRLGGFHLSMAAAQRWGAAGHGPAAMLGFEIRG